MIRHGTVRHGTAISREDKAAGKIQRTVWDDKVWWHIINRRRGGGIKQTCGVKCRTVCHGDNRDMSRDEATGSRERTVYSVVWYGSVRCQKSRGVAAGARRAYARFQCGTVKTTRTSSSYVSHEPPPSKLSRRLLLGTGCCCRCDSHVSSLPQSSPWSRQNTRP